MGWWSFPWSLWSFLSPQSFWYPVRLCEGAGELDCQAWLQVVTANGKDLFCKAQDLYLGQAASLFKSHQQPLGPQTWTCWTKRKVSQSLSQERRTDRAGKGHSSSSGCILHSPSHTVLWVPLACAEIEWGREKHFIGGSVLIMLSPWPQPEPRGTGSSASQEALAPLPPQEKGVMLLTQ